MTTCHACGSTNTKTGPQSHWGRPRWCLNCGNEWTNPQ